MGVPRDSAKSHARSQPASHPGRLGESRIATLSVGCCSVAASLGRGCMSDSRHARRESTTSPRASRPSHPSLIRVDTSVDPPRVADGIFKTSIFRQNQLPPPPPAPSSWRTLFGVPSHVRVPMQHAPGASGHCACRAKRPGHGQKAAWPSPGRVALTDLRISAYLLLTQVRRPVAPLWADQPGALRLELNGSLWCSPLDGPAAMAALRCMRGEMGRRFHAPTAPPKRTVRGFARSVGSADRNCPALVASLI